QKEFMNGGVSKRYAERRTFFLEPKRSATRRETDSYGFRLRLKTAYIPPSGMLAVFFLAVYP
ncbi:MAG: hypothetical protein WC637_15920, partial [Victivallales bacterium]